MSDDGASRQLDERSVGWLRYLHRKATTPDSWDREGQPHEHWDDLSDPPMLCWHRFDLIDSTYAVAMMADITPAWREVYARILDELIFRHTGWWAARDWLTQIGHDPDRANYPDIYRLLIPEHLWGNYDVPGWTANGIEPWGLQMDPIGATGNLFFKGFFLVMLGLHLRTTGDERWNSPFDIVRDGENTFTWFHTAIAEHLHQQWTDAPDGCHCENTKVWPYCLAGAGLGLQLHDLLRGTNHHEVFDDWFERRVPQQVPAPRRRRAAAGGHALLRPDPRRAPRGAGDVRHGSRAVPRAAGARRRAPALRGGHAPVRHVGTDRSGRTVRPARVGDRVVAREGVGAAAARGRARRDGRTSTTSRPGIATRGEFTWGFELDEPHPRGQYNGTMAAAQVATEQAWTRLATVGPGTRFTEPTVVDVDFPTVALTRSVVGRAAAARCSSRPIRSTSARPAPDDVPRREPRRSRRAGRSSSKTVGKCEPNRSATRSKCTRPRRPAAPNSPVT